MTDMPAQIGPYRVEREIGRGGMGVVYLARDTTLDRYVAIKTLPDELSDDADRLARFEREARTLAALNHANIATIFGLEVVDDRRYLILEYVEGDTLEDRLRRGPMPVDVAIRTAIQVARAVEGAHERGIIHRDLKPANIKFTTTADGEEQVKVLDFGLAKALNAPHSSAPAMDSPTVVAGDSPTLAGAILGTAGYLSPEQARGRPVDKRTDIFSFGCVLYEMLTGQPPFTGETATDSIGATLYKEISLDSIPRAVPFMARHVLRRCLERDRRDRLHDIADARLELEDALLTPTADEETTAAPRLRRGVLLSACAAIALLLLLIGLVIGRQLDGVSGDVGVVHVAIAPPPGTELRLIGDLAGPAAISPDGSTFVFGAAVENEQQTLWVRRLDQPEAREVPGTEGGMFPFWSPDSRSVGFFTRTELKRADLATGTVMSLCAVEQARGGAWTQDGRIIFSPRFVSGLSIVDATGGAVSELTTPEERLHTTHRWPMALPDGNRYLFFAGHRDPSRRADQGIYIGDLDGGEPRLLAQANLAGQYVDGWLLFVRNDVMLASRADLDRGELVGQVRVVARNVNTDPSTWHPQFSASASGRMVLNRRRGAARVDRLEVSAGHEADQLTIFKFDGVPATHLAVGMPIGFVSLSPDGHTMAVAIISREGTLDLWLYPTAFEQALGDGVISQRMVEAVMNPHARRFTFHEGSESFAVWSPDGTRIAYARIDSPEGTAGIYIKPIEGGPEEFLLPATEAAGVPMAWSPDGKYLVYKRGTSETLPSDDIWVLPLDGGDSFPLIEDQGADSTARLSPDGRWLAWTASPSGVSDVFVTPFAPAWPEETSGRRWQVSLDGGRSPRWRKDGTELYYIADSGMLMKVRVSAASETFEAGRPEPLFQTPFDTGMQYDVFPTQEHVDTNGTDVPFLFMDNRQPPETPISVILNWQRLLDDRR